MIAIAFRPLTEIGMQLSENNSNNSATCWECNGFHYWHDFTLIWPQKGIFLYLASYVCFNLFLAQQAEGIWHNFFW